MYKLFMALRYLRANPVVYFSILGVAIGIAAIVVVNSVMSGFSRDIRERIRGMQSHLVIKGRSADIHLDDYESLLAKIRTLPHVAGAAPRVQTYAWLGYTGREADAVVVGIDPAQERGASKVEEFFRRGEKANFDFLYDSGEKPTHSGIVVGSELAKLFGGRGIGAAPGLMTASRRGTVPQLFNSNFEVVGNFNSGMNEYDTGFIFMDLEAAQRFLRLRGPAQRPVISYVAVNIDDYARNVEKVRQAVLDLLHDREPCRFPNEIHPFGICGSYVTRTWEEEKRNLLQAVAIEKGLQVVLLFIIILVAGFNILTIYTLMVRAKTRDIGILRSLGASTPGIAEVFLVSGLLCGLIGGAFGSIGGLKGAVNLDSVAEVVETGSRELADWARGAQESILTWGSSWALLALESGLAVLLVLALLKGQRLRPAMTMTFGVLWVALLSLAAFGLVRDSATGWSSLITRGLSWLVMALTLAPLAMMPSQKPPPAMARFRTVAFAAAGLAFALSFAGFAGRPGFWEILASDYLFNVMITLTAIALAYGYAANWRRSPAPYWVNALMVFPVVPILLWLSQLLTDPPPPGWPGLNLFPKDVYYLDRIPSEVSYPFIGLIIVAATITAVAASVYPAVKAAQFDPVEAIRRE